LKALLLASEQVVRERDEVVAGLSEQLTTSSVEIEHLKLMIAKLRRMQFGRKSEKLDHQIEQLELQLEDLQAAEGEAEAWLRHVLARIADHSVNHIDDFLPWNCSAQLGSPC
jgi:hypothetical protein